MLYAPFLSEHRTSIRGLTGLAVHQRGRGGHRPSDQSLQKRVELLKHLDDSISRVRLNDSEAPVESSSPPSRKSKQYEQFKRSSDMQRPCTILQTLSKHSLQKEVGGTYSPQEPVSSLGASCPLVCTVIQFLRNYNYILYKYYIVSLCYAVFIYAA